MTLKNARLWGLLWVLVLDSFDVLDLWTITSSVLRLASIRK